MNLTTIRDDLFLPVSNDFPDFFFLLPCRSAGGEGVSDEMIRNVIQKMTFLTGRRAVAVLKNKLMRMIFTGHSPFKMGCTGRSPAQAGSETVFLDAIPNPAKSRTVFHYRLPETIEVAQIIVTSIDGRTIKMMDVEGTLGQTEWDTKGVAEGIYIYRLITGHAVLQTKRLVIIK